jgi:hypothetical protein
VWVAVAVLGATALAPFIDPVEVPRPDRGRRFALFFKVVF